MLVWGLKWGFGGIIIQDMRFRGQNIQFRWKVFWGSQRGQKGSRGQNNEFWVKMGSLVENMVIGDKI